MITIDMDMPRNCMECNLTTQEWDEINMWSGLFCACTDKCVDEYIKWNGLKSASHPQALELRDKAAAYYVILKNGKFFKDFYVYFETNNATSLIRLWVHEDLFAYCIDYLSKEYDTLVLASFEEHDISNIIKRYCTILKEVEKEYRYFDGRMMKYIEFTVSLKKND